MPLTRQLREHTRRPLTKTTGGGDDKEPVMYTQHNSTSLVTSNGRIIDLINPHSDSIDVIDIAHGLSQLSRYGGHALHFYSVAQHCCMVADLVPAEDRLAALLHAAPSAYLGEVIRPVQQLLPQYTTLERSVWFAICDHFGIDIALPDSVEAAKQIAMATERMDLLHERTPKWGCLEGVQPLDGPLYPWSPEEARVRYLNRLLEEMQARVRRVHGQGGPEQGTSNDVF